MKPIILIAALLWISIPAFSQKMTLQEIENDLNNTYRVIMNNREYGPVTDSLILDSLHPASSTVYYHEGLPLDSLGFYNHLFDKKMEYYTTHFPATLTYPFDSLIKDGIDIISSGDSLFRIYSWDRCDGGTMHFFDNLFQFASGGKVFTKLFVETESNPGEFYSQIFTLKANGTTYYLAIGNGIYSGRDCGQSIETYTIENHSLNDSVKLIKTREGLVNSLSIGFNFFSVVNHPERPLRLIKYDSSKKILSIPVVDDNEKVTNRYLLYQFNGKYFQFIKTTGSR
jgi:hypothetical protein